MVHPNEIKFSLSDYDEDGDKVKNGVFLHFGNTRVKVAETVKAFRAIVPHFEAMIEEIENIYPNVP